MEGRYSDRMIGPQASQPEELSDATQLLHRLEAGDDSAAELLLPLVYQQLRAIAGSYFKGQRPDHTLQPTALVHEAYLKLISADAGFENRDHFCAVASIAMRQILANHAEARRAAKRGGDKDAKRIPLETIALTPTDHAIDIVALDDALTKLQCADPGLSRIVELCYFGGLTLDAAAANLNVSRSTVARGWRRARAMLNAELSTAG